MGRDYAPRAGNGRQTRNRSKGAGMPSWVWLIAGLSLGLAVAAMVYISRPATPLPGWPAQAAAILPAPEAAKRPGAKPRPRQPLELPPKEKPRFTFYELLPNQEVIVPRPDPRDDGKAGAAPPVDNGTYLIQVASYKAQDEANRQKASLALLGVESRVETVTIDGKDTFYRVRIGPERDWNRVQLLLSRLEDNGIEALVVRVK